jgi:hypothetical protein
MLILAKRTQSQKADDHPAAVHFGETNPNTGRLFGETNRVQVIAGFSRDEPNTEQQGARDFRVGQFLTASYTAGA